MDLQKRAGYMDKIKKDFLTLSEDELAKLQNSKRKTALQRMNALFDEGTFVEIGAYVKRRTTEADLLSSSEYEGVVTGYGSVGGKLVYAYIQDFSRKSGALSLAGIKKIMSVYTLAEKNGAPIVSVFDSYGVLLTEGMDALSGYGAIINKAAILSGIIPQYSVVAGTCAGAAAVLASMSDFIIVDKINGKLFLNSPFTIKNNDMAALDLGSAKFNAKNGMCSYAGENEDDCFSKVKTLINYLPSNNFDDNVYADANDDINRLSENIKNIINTENYDVKSVIEDIADDNVFVETSSDYSENLVTGFISVGNITVGVVANQTKIEKGTLCPGALDKAARFIYICDNFNIPVLTIVDTDGLVISAKAEECQFALYAAKLSAAYAHATVPKITLNTGKAIGTAYMILGSKELGADMVMAYRGAQISILNADTAVELLYSEQISKSGDPAAERAKLEEKWLIETSSPAEAAISGQIDCIIEEDKTRQFIASSILMLQSKRESRPPKKYNKLPL